MSVGTTLRTCALTFEPYLQDRVWGGRHLEAYGRNLPADVPIGESWEISAIPGRSSVIASGPHAGCEFVDLLREHRTAIVGTRAQAPSLFPLLVKLLDSTTPLSVQLHPNDAEALRLEGTGEGKLGKTEAWIILEAEPGAEVIHGLAPGVDAAEFYRRMQEVGGGKLDPQEERDWFRWVAVRAGDVVFVPAGTIHALGAGVVLAEVQQNSDITYRIYDWGRQDQGGNTRDLHIDKAIQVAAPEDVPCPLTNLADTPRDGEALAPILECDKFSFDLIRLEAGQTFRADTRSDGESRFHLLFAHTGRVECRVADDVCEVGPTSFVLVPACTGEWELEARDGAASAILVR